jgi:hypothetical protein
MNVENNLQLYEQNGFIKLDDILDDPEEELKPAL